MKKLAVTAVIIAGMAFSNADAFAQYKTKNAPEEAPKSESELILEEAASSEAPVIITLEQALQIALSENVSVKVADMEIPAKVNSRVDIQSLFFSQAARTLACNSIPTVYEGDGVCGIVFDENARNLPLIALKKALGQEK
jgi:hypothetical protein